MSSGTPKRAIRDPRPHAAVDRSRIGLRPSGMTLRNKSLADLLFRQLGERLRELAGARLATRLHDQDHGLGAGTGRVGADDLVDGEGRGGANAGDRASPRLHALDRLGLRRRLALSAAEETEAHGQPGSVRMPAWPSPAPKARR